MRKVFVEPSPKDYSFIIVSSLFRGGSVGNIFRSFFDHGSFECANKKADTVRSGIL